MSLYEIIWAITLRSPVFIAAVLLQTLLFCRGYSQGGSQQQILALLGDDVILPCSLKTPTDASHLQLEWARTDLSPGFIHIWEKMKENVEFKQPSYVGRTSLSSDKLKHGDVSLTLSKVQLSDEGPYRCFIPQLPLELFVDLIVGSVSAPVMKVISNHSSRVVLQCESAGWYPEPELLWLDGEGNLLSARPTETLRGPDDLYTVSSSVTVEKGHSNNITCRVQQKNINQSRETHIHVPDDFFMVISPSGPPSDPTFDPNAITVSAISAVVVLMILAVFFAVWKRRQVICRNKKKSEEDGPEQTRKEIMMDSKNDNRECHVVVEEGESEPLMAGREEKDDVVSRGEQRHEEERKTKQDQFVLETEQTKDNPQEKRINPSAIVQKESLITIEKETQEDVTGRQERNDVESRGEQSNKDERETKDHQEELKEGLRRSEEERKQSVKKEKIQEARKHQNIRKVKKHVKKQNDDHMEVDDDAAHSQCAAITQQHETMKWTKEQQMLSEQKETQRYLREHDEDQLEAKEYSGLQFPSFTEEHKEQPVLLKEAKPFNLTSHLNSHQEPWKEKEKQNEQLVEKRQRESDESRKKSDTEKNRSGVNKIYSIFKTPKKTREHQREKLESEQQREKNQRKKQSETRMEREKDETEVKIRKSKNQHHKEEKTQERNEEESENEKHGEENQRDRMGMTERKTEEQRDQEERLNSSVSSKVTANTDLKTQEKEPEEKCEQSREEIREQPVFLAGAESFNFTFHLNTDQKPWREKEKQQPEKQRRAQSEGGGQREMMKINEGVTSDGTNRKEREKLQLRHEGALQAEQQENVNQKEEPEEPVSVTERGVDCLEEPQQEELMDQTPDVDQHNMQSRKHTQEIKLHEVCNLPAKKQKIQEESRARKHQNVRKLKKFVKKQNDDHMQVDDAAHSQYAAITQQHETMKWTNEQQMLSEQKETQGYLREHDEDQMEVN